MVYIVTHTLKDKIIPTYKHTPTQITFTSADNMNMLDAGAAN